LKDQIVIGIVITIITSLIILLLVLFQVLKLDIVLPIVVGALIGAIGPMWFFILSTNKNTSKSRETKLLKIRKKEGKFEAEIVNKKSYYYRGLDVVRFRSKYEGKLRNGYFVNEIFVPEVDPKYQSHYLFSFSTPDVSNDRRSAKSYCSETIDNTSRNEGNLNNYVESGWVSWEWRIPSDAPLNTYRVKMMVFNDGKEDVLKTKEDTFEVLNPSSSYDPYNRINMGD
jgi:hypothetical protein